jgi:amino acid transporter
MASITSLLVLYNAWVRQASLEAVIGVVVGVFFLGLMICLFLQKRFMKTRRKIEPINSVNWHSLWPAALTIVAVLIVGILLGTVIPPIIHHAGNYSAGSPTTLVTIPEPSSSAKISEVNTNWEAKFSKSNPYESGEMSTLGYEAWVASNYVYSAMFYRHAVKNEPDGSWQANIPLFYAVELAQNPTAEGYKRFNEQLDSLVKEIPHWNHQPAVVQVLRRLGEVKLRLPTSKQDHISVVIAEVEKIRDNKQP